MYSIYRVQDINLEDSPLKKEYYNKFLSGDINGAQNIYKTNPQLNGKVLNAQMLNQVLSSILNLETKYDTSVTQQLLSELDRMQINIDELIYMQIYSPTKAYRVNNFVLYGEDIYYCFKQPSIGTLPTDSNFWIRLGLKGEQGAPAIDVDYKGAWNVKAQYIKYDMVTYRNELYVALTDVVGATPTDKTKWFKAVSVEVKGILYGDTPPPTIQSGDIFIKNL